MTNSKGTVDLVVHWDTVQPDYRPYKPANPLIAVDANIIIKVPMKEELLANYVTIAGEQVSGQTESKPVLTPLGMRYVIDELEKVMSNPEEESEKNKDWEDTDTKDLDEDGEHPGNNGDNGWNESETDEPSVEKSEDKWNEDWS